MNSTTVSRRAFIASSGSLAVGISLNLASAEQAFAAGGGSVKADAWVVVSAASPAGTGTLVTIYAGKVELGTGVQTALSQIVAEELNVTLDQVAYVQGDTDSTSGSTGFTAGSKSVQNDGPPMRRAAATAMQSLMALAASQLGVPASQLQAVAGRIGPKGSRSGWKSYGEWIGAQTVTLASAANAPVKAPADYTLVGQPIPRVDLPGKFKAGFSYVGDLVLPGMVHARVVRPSGHNATFNSFKAGTDAALAVIPGYMGKYQVGRFVFVVGSTEYAAISAQTTLSRGALAVNWNAGPAFISQASLPTALQDPAQIYASGNEVNVGNVDTALTTAARTTSATYFTPFQMHGAMGASAAVATYSGGKLTVWSSTQGPYPLRSAIAVMLGLTEANVHVIYTEASGCYGHNGADDVAAEAALIAKTTGLPVRLQWTRAEENGWEPMGSAMLHKMRGGVTGTSVVAWEHGIYSASHNARPNSGTSAGNLLPTQAIGNMPADMPALNTNSATRNGPVTYVFANNRMIRNFVSNFKLASVRTTPRAAASPLTWLLPRTTALRSLGGFSNSFANESFMDELAKLANADPLTFRLAHTTDPRAAGVLNAVAAQAGWGSPLSGAPSGFARGRGLSCMRYETVEAYVATVVEVLVNTSTGAVQVTRVVVAHDCGLIINPDGLRNQIEGNVMQGISRTLKEEVKYTADRIVTLGWQDNPAFFLTGYPVINFDEMPVIESVLINQPNEVAWGAGETVIGTIGGAIGNAIANAIGKRVRTLPMLPATVLAAASA